MLLFYDKPVPLDRNVHRTAKLKHAAGGFSFAKTTNFVPVAGVEFAAAGREYPIVFSGSEVHTTVPVILVGLRRDENFFVDADGQWQDSYVPAFVRRYPFVLAEKGDDQFTVCVDEAYPGFNTTDGEPLFDAEGREQPFLRNTLDFLREYQGQMKRTQAFVRRLHELRLLTPKVVQVVPKNKSAFVMQGLQIVDEQKLLQLDDQQVQTLFRSGELSWIYAHLLSLANLQRLTSRLDRQGHQTAKPAAVTATPRIRKRSRVN